MRRLRSGVVRSTRSRFGTRRGRAAWIVSSPRTNASVPRSCTNRRPCDLGRARSVTLAQTCAEVAPRLPSRPASSARRPRKAIRVGPVGVPIVSALTDVRVHNVAMQRAKGRIPQPEPPARRPCTRAAKRVPRATPPARPRSNAVRGPRVLAHTGRGPGARDSGPHQAVAAGAMLAMIADTMIPEAFSETRNAAGLVTVLGFLAAFVVTKLGG
jgi:hypothetical protein